MISVHELRLMLADTESYNIERTTSTDNADKFCQAICAFSNDLAGSGKKGYLIIGAYDNGQLSGLKVEDRLLLQISNIRTDGNILPQPVMTVEKFSLENGDVLVAQVQPSEFPPVRYRGRVWVRVGPRKSIASEAEEKILTERRLSNVRTFDAMPCLGTSIAELDTGLIKREFLPRAVAEEVLEEDKRSLEEQLASLGLYDLRYNCPTNGAIILFGRSPERYLHGSYVQYVRFKGHDRAGDIINEHKFGGNLCRELLKMDAFIETSIAQKRPIPVSVLREETVAKYPYWATRELLMNAIMHRDYETNAPVLFYEYDDRIEIQNPGGLYGKVSPTNFPNVSDYRNPFIAEVMKILGYVNRFSRGVYRVQKELRENGNGEALFDFSLVTAFRVIEKVSVQYLEEGFGADEPQDNAQKAQEKAQKVLKKAQETEGNVQKAQEKAPEVMEKAQEVEGNVQKAQETLRKAQYPRKKAQEQQEKAQESRGSVQEPYEIYQVRAPRHIQSKMLDIIEENPGVTRNELALLLGTTPYSIKYHLRQLTANGILAREGSTKAGRWVVRPRQ